MNIRIPPSVMMAMEFDVEECSQKCLGLSIVNSYVEDKLKGSMQLNLQRMKQQFHSR